LRQGQLKTQKTTSQDRTGTDDAGPLYRSTAYRLDSEPDNISDGVEPSLACIEQREVIEKILTHLGLWLSGEPILDPRHRQSFVDLDDGTPQTS